MAQIGILRNKYVSPDFMGTLSKDGGKGEGDIVEICCLMFGKIVLYI
jgi:hypothetical protein